MVDGRSDDQTVAEAQAVAADWPVVQVLDNPDKYVPTALNIGIRAARGSVIVRMDAHSLYPRDYVETLVMRLLETGADNVGGVWNTVPGADTPVARGIAAALAHPLAVGNAQYRVGATQEQWVDTVPFGCYRREVFERVGLFDEAMIRNQDDEFNHRLLKAGGRILLVPRVVITYFARSTFDKLARMMYQYGLFKPLAARKVGRVTTVRQLVPAVFVAGTVGLSIAGLLVPAALTLLAALWLLYLLLVLGVALQHGLRRGSTEAPVVAAAIPVIHVAYGIGYLQGLLRLARHGTTVVEPGHTVASSR